jgi:hypothetical protein
MGSAAVAEFLASTEDLDELYKLNASETGPEDDEDNEEDKEDDEDGGIKPDEMPEPEAAAERVRMRVARIRTRLVPAAHSACQGAGHPNLPFAVRQSLSASSGR